MAKPIYNRECEDRYPHAKDVFERDFSEGGFAAGWAMHAKPVPGYFFDCHVHYDGPRDGLIKDHVGAPLAKAESLGVRRAGLMPQLYGTKWKPANEPGNIMDKFPYFTADELKNSLKGLADDEKIFWGPYINYNSPEPDLIDAAADLGASFVKLHNAPQIEDNAPPDLWLGREWRETFKVIAKRGLPVLWHVTQRLPSSVYTGGGRNSYWQKGWENGTKYSNEDLLQVFLTCCRHFPDIAFIGAHQLHIGWDRLDGLFAGYPNLYVDSTIGCMLKLYDDFYAHDKEYLRQVFMRRADRIIFGTDTFWGSAGAEFNENVVLEHIRFITALDLNEDALDKICHGNIERLMKIHSLKAEGGPY